MNLHIDLIIRPVAQTASRIPFAVREKVEKELQNLLDSDVIEPVEGPTLWISPIVVVPKSSGDVRCVWICEEQVRLSLGIGVGTGG